MRLVIDASIAIKWFVRENLYEEARQLLAGDDLLFAPDFLAVEVANIAWKKARRGEITAAQASEIAIASHDGEPTLLPSASLIFRATHLALTLEHPVYDCLYLACAEAVNGVLVTSDIRLHRVAAGSPYDTRVRLLGEPGNIPGRN